MPEYEALGFNPPAPVAKVTVREPSSGASCEDIRLLIDSGADATLLPSRVARLLGLSVDRSRRYELEAFDGSRSQAPIVDVEVLFAGCSFRGHFLLIDQECGVLGGMCSTALR